jgi:hypothetical protein
MVSQKKQTISIERYLFSAMLGTYASVDPSSYNVFNDRIVHVLDHLHAMTMTEIDGDHYFPSSVLWIIIFLRFVLELLHLYADLQKFLLVHLFVYIICCYYQLFLCRKPWSVLAIGWKYILDVTGTAVGGSGSVKAGMVAVAIVPRGSYLPVMEQPTWIVEEIVGSRITGVIK